MKTLSDILGEAEGKKYKGKMSFEDDFGTTKLTGDVVDSKTNLPEMSFDEDLIYKYDEQGNKVVDVEAFNEIIKGAINDPKTEPFSKQELSKMGKFKEYKDGKFIDESGNEINLGAWNPNFGTGEAIKNQFKKQTFEKFAPFIKPSILSLPENEKKIALSSQPGILTRMRIQSNINLPNYNEYLQKGEAMFGTDYFIKRTSFSSDEEFSDAKKALQYGFIYNYDEKTGKLLSILSSPNDYFMSEIGDKNEIKGNPLKGGHAAEVKFNGQGEVSGISYMSKEEYKEKHDKINKLNIQMGEKLFKELPRNQKYFKDGKMIKETLSSLGKLSLRKLTSEDFLPENREKTLSKIAKSVFKSLTEDIMENEGIQVSVRKKGFSSGTAGYVSNISKLNGVLAAIEIGANTSYNEMSSDSDVLSVAIHEALHLINAKAPYHLSRDDSHYYPGYRPAKTKFEKNALMEVLNTAATNSVMRNIGFSNDFSKINGELSPEHLAKSGMNGYHDYSSAMLPLIGEMKFFKDRKIKSYEEIGDFYLEQISQGKGFNFLDFAKEQGIEDFEDKFQINLAMTSMFQGLYEYNKDGKLADYFFVDNGRNFGQMFSDYLMLYSPTYRMYYFGSSREIKHHVQEFFNKENSQGMWYIMNEAKYSNSHVADMTRNFLKYAQFEFVKKKLFKGK